MICEYYTPDQSVVRLALARGTALLSLNSFFHRVSSMDTAMDLKNARRCLLPSEKLLNLTKPT
jgi:hypothetical protein